MTTFIAIVVEAVVFSTLRLFYRLLWLSAHQSSIHSNYIVLIQCLIVLSVGFLVGLTWSSNVVL